MILTSEQARAYDRAAVEMGVPSLVLMENACRGAAAWVVSVAPEGPLVVLCGPGNNGGDGLGVARYLHTAGRSVEVLLGSDGLSGDASAQQNWCGRVGVPMEAIAGASARDLARRLEAAGRPWVVDALFGTGLSRPLEAPWSEWVEEVDRLRREGRLRGVLAVDLPSGLDADLGVPVGPHVVADGTVTFAAEKPACVLSPNAESCGAVTVVDLGFDPRELLGPPTLERLKEPEVAALLPPRAAGGHKGTFGHLLVIGGCRGMQGAPALTAGAALRSGVGMLTVAAPRGVAERLNLAVPEALTLGLAEDAGGSLTVDAVEAVAERTEGYDAVALGPGLGGVSTAREVARRLALSIDLPLVLDADGLNAFAGRLDDLRERSASTVLTPHPGELSRLLGVSRDEIVREPLAAAREAVERCGQTLVLKSAATVIAAPDGPTAVVREGNSGMATAGSGDVLTGVIGALLAAGVPPVAAARIGVWVHAAAGSKAAEERSQAGLVAHDLIDCLGKVWRRFEGRGR